MLPDPALTDGAGLVPRTLARHALGVPADARAVMVVVDSWSPTPRGRRRASHAVAAGQAQASALLDDVVSARRRVVTIEGMAAMVRWWDLLGDRQGEVAEQMAAGRVWLDVLGDVPADVFAGPPPRWFDHVERSRRWLADRGLVPQVPAGRLPRGTELTPAVPSLLEAVGCAGVVVVDTGGRVDRAMPQVSDLRWAAPDGATVLLHRRGLAPRRAGVRRPVVPPGAGGDPTGGGAPTVGDVTTAGERRFRTWLRAEVDRLSAVSVTANLLCPVPTGSLPAGFDLTAALGRFNDAHHRSCGVWVVNGSLADYLTLVALDPPERVPVVAWDPPPPSVGCFFSGRGRTDSGRAGGAGRSDVERLGRPSEQQPVVRRLTGEVQVCVGDAVVRVDEVTGYVSVVDADGTPLLAAPSGELTAYVDSGDTERFGHELRGGVFRPTDRAARRRLDVEVTRRADAVCVSLHGLLDGRLVRRRIVAAAGFAGVVFYTEVEPRARRTVGMSLRTPSEPSAIDMAVPGGWVRDRAVAAPDGVAVWPLRTVARLRFPAARPMVVGTDVHTALGVFGSHLEMVVGRRTASSPWPSGRAGWRGVGGAAADERAAQGSCAVTTVVGWCGADAGLLDAERVVARGLAAAGPVVGDEAVGTDGFAAVVGEPPTDGLRNVVVNDPAVAVEDVAVEDVSGGADTAIVVRLSSPEPPRRPVRVVVPGALVAAAERCDPFGRTTSLPAGGRPGEAVVVTADGEAMVTIDRSVAHVRLTLR
ncbi:MAG: hypothetical protein JJU45_16160 [Acidimicrobiia bacterium]|nr:hypothetical protein [Acidimicrobiia bacterium]